MKLADMSDEELEKLGIETQNKKDELNNVLLQVAAEKDARYLKVQAAKRVASMSDGEKAAILVAMGIKSEEKVGTPG